MRAIGYTISIIFLFIGLAGMAQCDSVTNFCDHNLTNVYISDGQSSWALLYGDQVAEFDVTLFGGSTYRIAACSGDSDGNLIFRLYDQEKNLLFSNEDQANAPYWDFMIDSSIDCTLEAQLNLNKQESGCAVILIGFKR